MDDRLKEKLTDAGVDLESGLERFMGNETLYAKFAMRFTEDKNYAGLLAAMEAGDEKAAFEAAHTLKGVAGNLSFTRIYQRTSEVVEALRGGDLAEAQRKLPELCRAYEELKPVLEEWKG